MGLSVMTSLYNILLISYSSSSSSINVSSDDFEGSNKFCNNGNTNIDIMMFG